MDSDALDVLLDHMEPVGLKQAHGSMVVTLKANHPESDDFLLLALIHRIEVQIMRLDGTRPSLSSY